jgi:hypothetical protein
MLKGPLYEKGENNINRLKDMEPAFHLLAYLIISYIKGIKLSEIIKLE